MSDHPDLWIAPSHLLLLHGTSSVVTARLLDKREALRAPFLTNSHALARRYADEAVEELGGEPVVLGALVRTQALDVDWARSLERGRGARCIADVPAEALRLNVNEHTVLGDHRPVRVPCRTRCFAHRDSRGGFRHVHSTEVAVRLCGNERIHPVWASPAEPEGAAYWGWCERKSGRISMIQRGRQLFEMCFPSGSAASEARGEGIAVPLAVSERELAPEHEPGAAAPGG
jgi:hypothetical protein